MKYPTVLLHNTSTDRWHPMPFRWAPAPSEDTDAEVTRYKSIGHHTEGFVTKDEAVAHVQATEEFVLFGLEYEWDGTDIPATVQWFPSPHKLCSTKED